MTKRNSTVVTESSDRENAPNYVPISDEIATDYMFLSHASFKILLLLHARFQYTEPHDDYCLLSLNELRRLTYTGSSATVVKACSELARFDLITIERGQAGATNRYPLVESFTRFSKETTRPIRRTIETEDTL